MAVRSDAENEYVGRTTSLPTAASMTLCGWAIRDVDRGAWSTLATVGDGGATNIIEVSDNGSGSLVLYSATAGTVTIGTVPGVGVPFFWFFTWAGTGASQLVGGFRLASSTALTTASSQQASFTMGDLRVLDGQTAGEWFNGRAWNVKAWDRALSTDELLNESYFERVLFPTSVHAHWRLRSTSDLGDRTGNGRTLSTGGTLADAEDTGHGLWAPPTLSKQLTNPPAPAATAFQTNAFQSNAFQIFGGSTGAPSGAISGSAAIVITPTATLTGSGALAGSAAITITPTGTLTGSGALAGSAALVFGGTNTLTGSGALAGSAAITFTPTGTLAGSGALAGSAALLFGGSAVADQSLLGTAALAFSNSGTLTGSGALAGSAGLTFSNTGTLVGSGALAGTAALAFTNAGDLTGLASGSISGSAALAFLNSGALTGAGALAGVAGISFANSATISGGSEEPARPFARKFRRKYALWIGGVKYLGTQEDFERLVSDTFGSTPESELPDMAVKLDVKKNTFDDDARKLEAEIVSSLREIHRKAYQEDLIRRDEEVLLLL